MEYMHAYPHLGNVLQGLLSVPPAEVLLNPFPPTRPGIRHVYRGDESSGRGASVGGRAHDRRGSSSSDARRGEEAGGRVGQGGRICERRGDRSVRKHGEMGTVIVRR